MPPPPPPPPQRNSSGSVPPAPPVRSSGGSGKAASMGFGAGNLDPLIDMEVCWLCQKSVPSSSIRSTPSGDFACLDCIAKSPPVPMAACSGCGRELELSKMTDMFGSLMCERCMAPRPVQQKSANQSRQRRARQSKRGDEGGGAISRFFNYRPFWIMVAITTAITGTIRIVTLIQKRQEATQTAPRQKGPPMPNYGQQIQEQQSRIQRQAMESSKATLDESRRVMEESQKRP